MCFEHQSIHPQVHGLLRDRMQQGTVAGNVTRIADDGDFRHGHFESDGNFPHRGIAVFFLTVLTEPAMDCPDRAFDRRTHTFNGTHPQ